MVLYLFSSLDFGTESPLIHDLFFQVQPFRKFRIFPFYHQ